MNWNIEYNGYRYYCIVFLLVVGKLQLQCEFYKRSERGENQFNRQLYYSDVFVMDDFN